MDAPEFVVGMPRADLRPLVERYQGYRQHGVTLRTHRGLPSRHVTLIISLAEPIRMVGMPRPDRAPTASRGFVGGLHATPALIAQDCVQAGIHVNVHPLGARRLFGVSADELVAEVLDLADLGVPALAALPDRLAEQRGWARRFTVLDEVLGAVAATGGAPAGEIGWAWRRMTTARGRIRVAALAEEIGWSRRHFGERFRRELGLTPKQAARVLRFERSGELLRSARAPELARIAVECGYYDQAHLSNEWRALAGCPPGTWVAEESPFLQESAPGECADGPPVR